MAQRELKFGPAPLDRVAYLTVFAQLRQSQSRESEAYDLYAAGLEATQKLGKNHPLASYCLDGLGEIDLARGRLDQSEDHFRESLTIRQAGLGEGHREVAYSLDGLARVARARHHDEEAESLFNDASTILARELGSAHPDSLTIASHRRRLKELPVRETHARRPSARFLAIPTLLAVGWQVLYAGKDWRVVEANIRRREAKEARTAHQASVAPHQPAKAHN